MNKTDLIDVIFKNQTGKTITKIQIGKIVDLLFESIANELNRGKEIQISDFGTFGLTEKITKPIIKVKSKLENTRKKKRKRTI